MHVWKRLLEQIFREERLEFYGDDISKTKGKFFYIASPIFPNTDVRDIIMKSLQGESKNDDESDSVPLLFNIHS